MTLPSNLFQSGVILAVGGYPVGGKSLRAYAKAAIANVLDSRLRRE
ncbi:MAG: hypothetical protein ABL985_10670 [Casimicrobium sp.]